MDQPEQKRRGLLGRPLFWFATLLLAACAVAFFVPLWPCPLCKGLNEVQITSRYTASCALCQGTKKVGLRVVVDKLLH
jgi:hypothetical protein